MLNMFAIMMRESLEAVLIVGLIIAFLKKQGLIASGKHYVWGGIVAGIALSGLLALALYHLGDWLDGLGLLYFEAALLSVSAALMVQLVFWMKRMGKEMKGLVEHNLSKSISKIGLYGIAAVSALAIAREGAETAIYLYSMSMSGDVDIPTLAATSFAAVFVSIFIGFNLIKGARFFNIATVFKITTIFLLMTASSLLLQAVSRLIEAQVLPPIIEPLWDTSSYIPLQSTVGSILKFLLGYQPKPTLMAVLLYSAYWVFILAKVTLNENSIFWYFHKLTKRIHSSPTSDKSA